MAKLQGKGVRSNRVTIENFLQKTSNVRGMIPVSVRIHIMFKYELLYVSVRGCVQMAKVTLSVPDDLYEKIERYKDLLNLSEIFRICASEELRKIESNERRLAEGFPWRQVRYADNVVTIAARPSKYGPTDWSLEIHSSKLEGKPLVVELGGEGWLLEKIIEGVDDYFHHLALKEQGIDLSRILPRDALSDLWLQIGILARKSNLRFSADVALLPPQQIRIRGRHGQVPFDDEVVPKPWRDVSKDESRVNVFFANFWMGSYTETGGTVFRLSSYIANQYNAASSDSRATRYIDFDPSDQSQAEEIRRIIAKASVVYLPDLSVKNVRSVIF